MKDELVVLQSQLETIQTKLKEASEQRLFNDSIYQLIREECNLQRRISLAKNEETAVILNFPYPWSTGAPRPHVISSGHKTFLIYYLNEKDPKWNPAALEIIDLQTEDDEITVLVEFIGCYDYKFGGTNDEVLHGHPLSTHGLEAYEAHSIINSKWLENLKKINSVHPCYRPDLYENYRHFIFTFKDEIFECIAEDYKVDVFKGRIKPIFDEATRRLFL